MSILTGGTRLISRLAGNDHHGIAKLLGHESATAYIVYTDIESERYYTEQHIGRDEWEHVSLCAPGTAKDCYIAQTSLPVAEVVFALWIEIERDCQE